MAAGGRSAHAHEQPRPRRGRAARGSRRVRRYGEGGAQLGVFRRHRARAAASSRRRNSDRSEWQACWSVSHASKLTEGSDREKQCRRTVADVVALTVVNTKRAHQVQAKEGRIMDIQRIARNREWHVRNTGISSPKTLQRKLGGPIRADQRTRRHGRSKAACDDNE